MSDSTNKKMANPKSNIIKNKSKLSSKDWMRIITLLFMSLAMCLGIYFSSAKWFSNYNLGSDFGTSFRATVGVYDSNSIDQTNINSTLPNGDASKAAEVLNDKVNPMGNLPITINQAGKNYLLVEAPASIYDNNPTLFRTSLQRSGGIFFLNSSYQDVLFTNYNKTNDSPITRTKMSDMFSDVNATTVSTGAINSPFMEFTVTSEQTEAFNNIIQTESSDGSGNNNQNAISILVNADAFFDDLRNYYTRGTKEQNNWWQVIIRNLQEAYTTVDSQILKDSIYDLFYGSYKLYNDATETSFDVIEGSLVDPSFTASFRKNSNDTITGNFNDVKDSWTYLTDTNKYIYDPNASDADFEQEGKYGTPVYMASSKNNGDPIGGNAYNATPNIQLIFTALANSLIPLSQQLSTTDFNDYILYNNQTVETSQTTTSAYFVDSKFMLPTSTYTLAKNSEVIYKTASKGYSFHVFTVNTLSNTISNLMLIISITVIALIALLMIIFLLVFYRLLGLFTIIVMLTSIALTLTACVWFNFAFGLDTLMAIFIVIGLSMDICVTLFEQVKKLHFRKNILVNQAFSIANKDTFGLAIDAIIVMIIPNIALFWLGNAMLKSFATLVTLGCFFTVIFVVLIGRLMFSLTINSPLYKNKPSLFALDVELSLALFGSNNAKIETYKQMIDKLEKTNDIKYKKKIDKLQAKINHINDIVSKREAKLQAKLQAKLNETKQQFNMLQENKVKYVNKLAKMSLKIDHYEYLLGSGTLNQLQDEAIVNDATTRVEEKPKSISDRISLYRSEKGIFNLSKIMLIIFSAIILLGTLIGIFVKPNYDDSFGAGTNYVVWGDYVSDIYENSMNDVQNGYFEKQSSYDGNDDEIKVSPEFENYTKNLINNYIESQQTNEDLVYMVGTWIQHIIQTKGLVNTLIGKDIYLPDVVVYYGTDYKINSSEGGQSDLLWISLQTTLTKKSDYKAVKNLLVALTGASGPNGNINSEDNGIEQQVLTPYSSVQNIIQLAWVLLVLILALIIYILIRFKWTYYIALICGILVSICVSVALIIIFQIPLSFPMFAAFAATIGIVSAFMLSILGHARNLVEQRDQKSLENHFDSETEFGAQIREARKALANNLHEKRKELMSKVITRKEAKTKQAKIERKLALAEIKNEFANYKVQQKLEFRDYKKDLMNKMSIAAKQNDYLKEVMVKLLKFTMWKAIFIMPFYLLFAFVLIFTMPTLFGFGLTTVIGLCVGLVVSMFILIPLWVIIEQVRIRNKMSIKRYVNRIKIEYEEQIVPGIND